MESAAKYQSHLDTLIPGEIKNDSLAELLKKLASLSDVRTILEIGSSSGEGSTEAIVSVLRSKAERTELHCVEVSGTRFGKLRDRYAGLDFVHCYRTSSVSTAEFATEEAVIASVEASPEGVAYPKETMIAWLQSDIAYVSNQAVDASGIALIKAQNAVEAFDLVLLDGGDFTGEADLRHVYGAKYIALNDIRSFKNAKCHLQLKADPVYKLLVEDFSYRNGFSLFVRTESPKGTSSLDVIIPGEIKNDQFHQALKSLAQLPDVKTILEIGSSAGGGSTDAFVSGLRERASGRADLYCMEVSEARFTQLRDTYKEYDFVHCYNVSSVALGDFPSREAVAEFYDTVQSGLRAYPKETVLGWLDADIEYVTTHGSDRNGIELIKSETGIERFDLVLIDGSEFTGDAELRYVYGAKYIALDDINTYKNWNAYFQLREDPNYELISENRGIRNGYCVFKRVDDSSKLPVHFFTIVLNGIPFIRYHIDMMSKLPFDWHWHIVEGVADLKHDTAWSVGNGGSVTDDIHLFGRSRDGTSEYLDELAAKYPDKVTIYRKPAGIHWEGKLEMVNAPLSNINQECLLWQIDVDEFWTVEQISSSRDLFIQDYSRTSAFYWCNFFVGKDRAVSTRNCYSQSPGVEWLRTWRYHPGCRWVAHEPPRLAILHRDGQWVDQGAIKPLLHAETEAAGLVFNHYAYAVEPQLRFKETYYGYRGAVDGWKRLQENENFPCSLRDYFPWVHDETQVETAEKLAISEIPDTGWIFEPNVERPSADIIVDAVFFQYFNTGIARLWRSLLTEWAGTNFGKRLLILDRAGKAPRIPGLRYLEFPSHDYANVLQDQIRIQKICDERQAKLFISTYYSSALRTPSVLVVYDMIPEVLNADLNQPMWIEKIQAIKKASAYVSISQHTAKDLRRFHPEISEDKITISYCGVDFERPSPDRIDAFRSKHGIDRPYFLISGGRSSYKNAIQFFKAFARFGDRRNNYAVVCTGPKEPLPPEFTALVGGASVHLVDLTDEELQCAYAGAISLVYPSLYEGFGMPIIEAMSCGCPVVTCPSASIPEVAADAAIYVPAHNVDAMYIALERVQQPETRDSLIEGGLERARKYSWKSMAEEVATVLNGVALRCDR